MIGTGALSPSVAKMVLEEMRAPKSTEQFNLSAREIEVLELLANDLSRKDIAGKRDIIYRTVTFHLTNIYEKLGIHSQLGALAKAYQIGIL